MTEYLILLFIFIVGICLNTKNIIDLLNDPDDHVGLFMFYVLCEFMLILVISLDIVKMIGELK